MASRYHRLRKERGKEEREMREYTIHVDSESNLDDQKVAAAEVEIENCGEAEDSIFLYYRFRDSNGTTIAIFPENLVVYITSTEIVPVVPEAEDAVHNTVG
jgi:hypothetical protein